MKPGAVVQLKSGGPKMTIKWVESSDAYCEWFSGAEVRGAKFSIAQLELVTAG